VVLGERYDCIMLDQKEYLHEAVDMLPAEKIMVDSTFAFEDTKKAFKRLNTGRARGEGGCRDWLKCKYEEVPSCHMAHTAFAKWFSKSD
jgi:hypothetical protein